MLILKGKQREPMACYTGSLCRSYTCSDSSVYLTRMFLCPQKIILQKVSRTYLYLCYQHLPEEVIEESCIYFLRNSPGMVPLPNSIEEANEMLPLYFEFGLLNGHSLVMLEQIISQVIKSRILIFVVML